MKLLKENSTRKILPKNRRLFLKQTTFVISEYCTYTNSYTYTIHRHTYLSVAASFLSFATLTHSFTSFDL